MDVYPIADGRIRTDALEVNVVEHCNLSCRGCSHLSPVIRRTLVEPERLLADLTVLTPHYRPDHVRLLGGEPLLHPKLDEVIDAVRASEISERIRIVTNGTALRKITERVWEGIDELHVSLYPGRHPTAPERRRVDDAAGAFGVTV